ncbi:hypothetical protein [Reyranella sp.]|jgi:hypothetical protein|uniref:hypothetical protein n=1 Tax=Reyranella sp. TaxID=1929291 RepID=UPI002F91CD54
MKSIICLALVTLLAGVLGGCAATTSDNSQKFANGYVPADHGFNSHKTYHSQADFYAHYRGIDGG